MSKILLVEDDLPIQRLYARILTNAHFDVVTAITGRDAIEKIRSEKPNIVLLDIMLPDELNGFDVLKAIKTDPVVSAIPVIMLTNLDSEREQAVALRATHYIVKADISEDDLLHIVKTVLTGSVTANP